MDPYSETSGIHVGFIGMKSPSVGGPLTVGAITRSLFGLLMASYFGDCGCPLPDSLAIGELGISTSPHGEFGAILEKGGRGDG